MMPRSTDFSANTIQSWDDRRWKANFRVNEVTFRYLCNELRGSTAEEFGQRGNTRGEESSYHIVEIGNQPGV